jgi:hypothetical protein
MCDEYLHGVLCGVLRRYCRVRSHSNTDDSANTTTDINTSSDWSKRMLPAHVQ